MKKMLFWIAFIIPFSGFSQYLESFLVPNKGILQGACSGTSGTTCTSSDFSGVDWTMTVTVPGATQGTSTDFFKSVSAGGGQLDAEDLDDEFCVITPILDVTAVTSTNSTISVGVTYVNIENDDYYNVLYSIDGGGYTQIPPIGGSAGPETFRPLLAPSISGSQTLSISSLNLTSNSTLQIKVCVDNNLVSDQMAIDQINAPAVGTVVLPVTWGFVKVRKLDGNNEVIWTTHTEINNDYFEIERTIGNENEFETIGRVDGNGNASFSNEYSFIDKTINTRSSDVHYRIKQVDYDGKYEYSPVVSIKSKKETKEIAIPNPFQNELTIYSDNIDTNQGNLTITDLQGHLIKDIKTIDESDDSITFDTSEFLPGVYFVKFPSGKVSRIIKI